jgi:hypothetical protein
MKTIVISIIFFNFIPLIVCSQTNRGDWLKLKFKQADTVLLVSHELVEGSTDEQIDSSGNTIPYPKLIVKHRPNSTIIREKVIVKGKKLDKLVGILTRRFQDSVISQGCILTHHAIFLIKNGHASFINLSFECGSFETSKDLSHILPFDKRRWRELEQFFKALGFRYYLEGE